MWMWVINTVLWMKRNKFRNNTLIQSHVGFFFSYSLLHAWYSVFFLALPHHWCSRISLCVTEIPMRSDLLLSLCIYFWRGFNSLYSNHDTELHLLLLITRGKVVSMATEKQKCGSWQGFRVTEMTAIFVK